MRVNVVSSLLSRVGLAGLLGVQYGGKRDLYSVFGYKTVLTYNDFWQKYKRQDVAKRIVNAPAAATWRNPPKVTGNKKYAEKWEELAEDHQLWWQIERVDRMAGIGQYAVLLLGFDDGRNMELPVNTERSNTLIYVQPYSQLAAEIIEIDDDPTSERFGLPKMYLIKTDDPMAMLMGNITQVVKTKTIKAKEFKVHYSRIVHIAEDVLESNFLGTPRLEAVYNLLDDLLKVAGGTAETYWLNGNRGMQVDIDKDAEMNTDDAADLASEVEEYQHQLTRIIKTRGVKINNLGADVPDPKNTFDMLVTLLSGATGIPKRILTGSEAGQLASDQDRANWADTIKERRTKFAEPGVLNPLHMRLIEAGVLPRVKLSKLEYAWPLNFQLTPLEESQSMAQKARAISNISKHYESQPLVTKEEARIMLGLPAQPAEGVIPERLETKTGNDQNQESTEKSAESQEEQDESLPTP